MHPPVRVLGVRHHSPACARVVRALIAELKPRFVLVEGPADANAGLADLLLPHALPIALFGFASEGERSGSCFTPLCEHSPEWVALTEGAAAGATVRFIDLPMWHPAWSGRVHRYADEAERWGSRIDALCRRVHVEGFDALWEHLFERAGTTAAALDLFFREVRPVGEGAIPDGDRDGPREAYMRRWIGWALAQGGPVLVVVGGFHPPALLDVAPAPGPEPEVPSPDPGVRTGSYIVPWSFERLDSFSGYDAGMPSPAFAAASWALGDGAWEPMFEELVSRIRESRFPLSSSDAIAARTLILGLARLRGHPAPTRIDLLEGLTCALLKDGLSEPAPWTRRAPLSRRTHPLLATLVRGLTGERIGRVAPATPRPPLVADVAAPLSRARTIELPLGVQLERSRVLHRLRLLGIPGYTRTVGPTWGTDVGRTEVWRVRYVVESEGVLIEAAAWGATLESAARERVVRRILHDEGDTAAIALALGDAALAGVLDLREWTPTVLRAIARERKLDRLGAAISRLHALWRFGQDLAPEAAAALRAALHTAIRRCGCLIEGMAGADAATPTAVIEAVRSLSVALRDCPEEQPASLAMVARTALRRDAPFGLRGACLGVVWAVDGADRSADAADALRSSTHPDAIGELLTGLFAVSREVLIASPALLAAIDHAVLGMGDAAFRAALPALRLAFSWFPPYERAQIAHQLRAAHPDDRPLSGASTGAIVAGLALDARVASWVSLYRLVAP
jgi:hypothetical protein